MDIKAIAKQNNWKVEKLDKVTFFQEGPGVREHQYTTNGVKLLNVANLFEGQLDLSRSERFISEEEAYGKYSHFLVDEGDLIIACSGIQVDYFHKKMGFAKKEHLPLCMNTSTMRFKTLNEKVLNIEYLAYFLKTDFFKKQIQKLITGSAQLNFGPSHIKKIDILTPPLETQKKIVEVLDKAQGLIDARKEQIKLMDELIQSVFYEMFGDISCNTEFNVKCLQDFSRIGSSKRIYAKEYVSSGIPFYRSKEIRELGTGKKPSVELYITEDKYKEIKSKYDVPQKGDILIAAIGATIGYRWIVENNEPFYYKDGNLILISEIENMDSLYMNYALEVLIDDFRNTSVSGSAQMALTIEKLKIMTMVCPPLELQSQFGNFVQSVDKLKSKVHNSLDEVQILYDSMMHKYFE
ncbi:MAG: restriction endonuclease subunit S [Vulcanibacillus sp.]